MQPFRNSFNYGKQALLLVILMSNLISNTANSQQVNWQPVILEGSIQTVLASKITGHNYQIYIDVPPGDAPENGFAIIYALDGGSTFATLRQINKQKARRSKVTGYQQAIIVAIGYKQSTNKLYDLRSKDYTPWIVNGGPNTGGADKFSQFIGKELKPLIFELFPVDRNKQAIFGHSYGGLFALHVLLNQPQLFTSYLASSPSLWWGDQMMLAQIPEAYSLSKNVFISVGSLEDQHAKRSPEIMKILANRKMLPSIKRFVAKISKRVFENQFEYIALKGEDHGSAKYAAISRALKFFLEPS